MLQAFHDSELRPTANRVRILELLRQAGVPLSPADVHQLDRALDRVTIYRTLALLSEHGLAHRIQGMDGVWRYCAHALEDESCGGNHPHFLCLSCGAMVCLQGQPLAHVEAPEGVEVQGKQMVLYGLCRTCLLKKK